MAFVLSFSSKRCRCCSMWALVLLLSWPGWPEYFKGVYPDLNTTDEGVNECTTLSTLLTQLSHSSSPVAAVRSSKCTGDLIDRLAHDALDRIAVLYLEVHHQTRAAFAWRPIPAPPVCRLMFTSTFTRRCDQVPCATGVGSR